ncbi:IspD/TarI family cytidylyltransferase [Bogoriella caseilytica]|uniref:2-C-methyl-D-erythritol 4-phosphate cytidylyltransferase n=1 Tax=Bogoriella caseilytica TaxID=56055 RepID=A0A3N2BDA3_9MICO|nr:2-C-methyl-D-erythritol 4-phosphate cytidylyltransferase [Bogoriella caseilytica]
MVSSVAVLTAAGSGTRLGPAGAGLPKGLVPLAGEPLVLRAARGLAAAGCLDGVVVTVPAGSLAEFRALFPGDVVPGSALPVAVVVGGATRQASVAAGLRGIRPLLASTGSTSESGACADVVLVHDAARCLTPPEVIRAVDAAVRAGRRAVVPAVAVTDTIKQTGPTEADGAAAVTATLHRAALRAVQTPQGFAGLLLEDAHAAGAEHGGDEATALSDDAGLVEAMGEQVYVVPGHERALKITTPVDLALAELLLSTEEGA